MFNVYTKCMPMESGIASRASARKESIFSGTFWVLGCLRLMHSKMYAPKPNKEPVELGHFYGEAELTIDVKSDDGHPHAGDQFTATPTSGSWKLRDTEQVIDLIFVLDDGQLIQAAFSVDRATRARFPADPTITGRLRDPDHVPASVLMNNAGSPRA